MVLIFLLEMSKNKVVYTARLFALFSRDYKSITVILCTLLSNNLAAAPRLGYCEARVSLSEPDATFLFLPTFGRLN